VLIGPTSQERLPREGSGYRPFALYGVDGRAIPVQVLARRVTQERTDATRHYPDQDEVDQVRVAFRAPLVPGLSAAALHAGGPVPLGKRDEARVRGRSLENRFVVVAFEQNGAITLVDRPRNERYTDLLRLEDGGDAGDAYSYCPPVRDRVAQSQGPITVRRVAAGPLIAALEARWEVTRGIAARLLMQLYADSPIVRATLDIDNRGTYHRSRAIADGLTDVPATAGTAFGLVERHAVAVEPGAYPRRRRCAQHRRIVSSRQPAAVEGSPFLRGVLRERMDGQGDMLLTRCAPSAICRVAICRRARSRRMAGAIPAAQCIGSTRIDLALAAVSVAEVERGDVLPRLGEDAFLPLNTLWLRDAAKLQLAPLDIALEGNGLVFSALKPAQIGSPLVLRCYNATNRKVAGAWRFGGGVKTAHRVRADEREAVALALEQRGNLVRFVAEPHEIVSIMVT
jgi:hypothetical protein